MNIGDRVRLLKGSEEGVITRFLDQGLIEIEIEDGFQIPVQEKEVVLIAPEEENYFQKGEEAAPPRERAKKGEQTKPAEIKKEKEGLYLAYRELNEQNLAVYLINNTEMDIPFSIIEEVEGKFRGLKSGMIRTQSSTKINEVNTRDFENWPELIVQFIFYKEGYFTFREPLVRKIKFRAGQLFKNKVLAPVIRENAYLIRLDHEKEESHEIPSINADQIKSSFFEDRTIYNKEKSWGFHIKRPPEMVDLHVEELAEDYQKMSNNEIFELQMKTFEDAMDAAIACGMDQITFVHGVGNGTLKQAIQKKLSKSEAISYFEDVQKEKFGYGATLVKIKG